MLTAHALISDQRPGPRPGVQGPGRAAQRVLRDLVPARRTFTSAFDFNTQLATWLAERANTRHLRSIFA